jgi:hypothetical protein
MAALAMANKWVLMGIMKSTVGMKGVNRGMAVRGMKVRPNRMHGNRRIKHGELSGCTHYPSIVVSRQRQVNQLELPLNATECAAFMSKVNAKCPYVL